MSNYPSLNPANRGDLVGAFNHILDKHEKNTDGMLPAKIISYDRAKNRAVIQPLIKIVATNGTQYDRPIIASIPVLQIGGGGFILSFNLTKGDLGWIKANDRDISLFLKNYTAEAPNTGRVKNFSDGIFIPDVMTGYNISSGDTAVLQSLDGSIKISLNSSMITIKNKATEIGISATGVNIISTTLTHNGVNVGDTHTHPQGADSAGNAEQDTGYPK